MVRCKRTCPCRTDSLMEDPRRLRQLRQSSESTLAKDLSDPTDTRQTGRGERCRRGVSRVARSWGLPGSTANFVPSAPGVFEKSPLATENLPPRGLPPE